MNLRVHGVSWLLFVAVIAGHEADSHRLSATGQSPTQPNVVLILMDDLGYGDLGSYGAPDVKTPNIDRLARQGVRFPEAYANAAVCSPTRAALMSGRYQQRVGLEWALGGAGTDLARGLTANGASLPALLKKSGYATGLVGKWHLGMKPEMGPNAHGFDEFFGFLGGAVDYYTHGGMDGKPDLYENTRPVTVAGYLTDEITSRSVSFVDRHARTPFFLEVAYSATHWPFQPPDRPPSAEQRRIHPSLYETPGEQGSHSRPDYVRMLERADEGVGEIMQALDRHGIAQNTLVIFTNDNGGEWLSRNAPFFNQKSTLWEGGIRVPLIMQWPDRLPAGKTSTQVTLTMDLTASVLAATGTPAAATLPPDGIDLISIARGVSPIVSRELVWRISQPTRVQRAVRSGPWKLLVEGNGVQDGIHVMLFDLSTDPGERHDLAWRYPERVSELRARIAAWELAVATDATSPISTLANSKQHGEPVLPALPAPFTWAVRPQFDSATPFSEGLAAVRVGDEKTGGWGFIDPRGTFVIPCQFAAARSFQSGLAAVRIGDEATGKWGFVDKQGRMIIGPRFDDAYPFSDGLAMVRLGDEAAGKWGFIDRQGRMAIAAQFHWPDSFYEGLASVQTGDESARRAGFIDKSGRIVIDAPFDGVRWFSGGLAAVRVGDAATGKWGFIDKQGRVAVRPQFDDAYAFSEGLAAIRVGDIKTGKRGFIDRTGRVVIEPLFSWAESFAEGLAAVRIGDAAAGAYGYIDNNGRIVIKTPFTLAGSFSEGLAPVGLRESTGPKWGFIDKRGQVVITPRFDGVHRFSERLAMVRVGDKWGYIAR